MITAGSDCVVTPGSGSAGDPYVIDVLIDPNVENLLSCEQNGLLAVLDAQAGSSCVSVSGVGTAGDPVIVDVVIDPDPLNTLECRGGGLFTEGGAGILECAYRRSFMGV